MPNSELFSYLADILSASKIDQRPCIFYSAPNDQNIHHYSGQARVITDHFQDSSGFLVAPFDREEHPSYLFDNEMCDYDSFSNVICLTEQLDLKPIQIIKSAINPHYRYGYLAAQACIKRKDLDKLVLSRKIQLPVSSLDDAKMLKLLFCSNVQSFRYLFYHPKEGIWVGQSPEQLIQHTGHSIRIASLAGTKWIEGDLWSNKEIEEQKIVTWYIKDKIEQWVNNIHVSSKQTIQAGSLRHLYNEFTADLFRQDSLIDILHALHPTPATCGYPCESAKSWVDELEPHDRRYYSGYIGEWRTLDGISEALHTDLYVNLRCARILGKELEIYVGGGITVDSNLEDEWAETEAKRTTIETLIRSSLIQ